VPWSYAQIFENRPTAELLNEAFRPLYDWLTSDPIKISRATELATIVRDRGSFWESRHTALAAVHAVHPLPAMCTSHYFEVSLLSWSVNIPDTTRNAPSGTLEWQHFEKEQKRAHGRILRRSVRFLKTRCFPSLSNGEVSSVLAQLRRDETVNVNLYGTAELAFAWFQYYFESSERTLRPRGFWKNELAFGRGTLQEPRYRFVGHVPEAWFLTLTAIFGATLSAVADVKAGKTSSCRRQQFVEFKETNWPHFRLSRGFLDRIVQEAVPVVMLPPHRTGKQVERGFVVAPAFLGFSGVTPNKGARLFHQALDRFTKERNLRSARGTYGSRERRIRDVVVRDIRETVRIHAYVRSKLMR
jgi:hypothetical protein